MPPVNKARGEMRVRIGAVEFVLVPSHANFAAIEEATGLGAFVALERLRSGSLSVATAVLACASDSKLSRDQIGDLILDSEGLGPVWPQLYLFMSQVASGFDRVNELLAKDGAAGEAAPAGDTKSGDGSPLG
jgi:hypothetical protein